MTRLQVTDRNDGLCDILEHVKFPEFQDSEPHIERFVDGDCDLVEIESHKVLVEHADPLKFWFARERLKLFRVGKESDFSGLPLLITCLAVD